METGWGNGYVLLPKGHPCYGMDYDSIHNKYDIDVHYGLTFAGSASNFDWKEIRKEDKDKWMIGFDTAHYGDNLKKWPKEAVQKEADNLLKQMEIISNKALK